MRLLRLILLSILMTSLAACQNAAPTGPESSAESKTPTDANAISFGDGQANWIVTEGATQNGATYLTSGDNESVAVVLDAEPASGNFSLVMLHSDVNENQEFDFVSVDERNVLDKAVFEGMTRIAHPMKAP